MTVAMTWHGIAKTTGKMIPCQHDLHKWTVKDGKIVGFKMYLCDPASLDAAFEMSPSTAVIMKLYQKWGEGAFNGDGALEASAEFMAPDGWIDGTHNGVKNTKIFGRYEGGAKAMADFCANLLEIDFQEPKFYPKGEFGDTVTVLMTWHGVVKATGKEIPHIDDVHKWTVKDGKVTGFKMYLSNAPAVDAAYVA